MAILVAVVLCGAAAELAEAKGERTVSVCGASACMSTDDPGLVGSLHSTFARAPVPEAAPFYVVRFDVRGPRDSWSYVFAPSVRAMRADDFGEGAPRWQDASPLLSSLPDLSRLDPYPASAAWRWSRAPRRELPWIRFPAAAERADIVKVCGVSACIETDIQKQVVPLRSNIGAPLSTAAEGPSYVVRFAERTKDGQRHEVWSYLYVPSAGAMRSDEFGHGPARWRDVPEEITAALPDLHGLAPIAVSTRGAPVRA
jgi:hypothetical protein